MNIKTANRLCELRKAHNLSQEELASKLGVSRQAVSKWERSESSPDTDNLIQLASLYNISLDELLNGEEAISLIEENKESYDVIKGKMVELDDGYKVLIEGDNATVIDGEIRESFSLEETVNWNKKIEKIKGIATASAAIVITTIYLTLGFTIEIGWDFWFLFILIPVPSGIIDVILRKKLNELPVEIVVASLYCALGVFLGLWHPLWILFLIIPAFRVFTSIFKSKKDYKQKVLDANERLNGED